MVEPSYTNVLTPEEEKQMDFISNAIIDIILSKRKIPTKTPLLCSEKDNNFIVKGNMK